MNDRRSGQSPDTSPEASREPQSEPWSAHQPHPPSAPASQATLPQSGVQPHAQGQAPASAEHEGPATTRYDAQPTQAPPPGVVSPPSFVPTHSAPSYPQGYGRGYAPGAYPSAPPGAGYGPPPQAPAYQAYPQPPSYPAQATYPAAQPPQYTEQPRYAAPPQQASQQTHPAEAQPAAQRVSASAPPPERSLTPPPATMSAVALSQRAPVSLRSSLESGGPISGLDKTIAPGDMGRRTISLTSPMGHTQVMHPEAELIPDSGARLIASGASTQSVQGAELHPEAPEWMRMGRLLALQIEDAIAQNRDDAPTRAAIMRAWSAWQLGGHSRRQIKDIADNLMRAYKMAMHASIDNRDAVLNDCAGVLYSTLPAFLRKSCDRNRVIVALQLMSEFDDPETARFEGLAVVLRWSDQARELGKQAVRCLLAEET